MKFAMIKKSYIVAGPTASGKSSFAHDLAKKVGGTIINADAVQIYRGIENISASPFACTNHEPRSGQRPYDKTNHEIDGVPYRLFSIKDLADHVSVAEYLEMARAEYDAADVPIFVGGSGYYINALINGISPIPDVSAMVRERARKMINDAPDEARNMINFKFSDPQRMARELEVFLETGRPLSEWQKLPRVGAVCPNAEKILIMPPKEVLHNRIRERLRVMMDNGGLDEVRRFIDYPDRAIGIDEIGKFLRGDVALSEAIEQWAVRTDQYAKRQRTWFRNQFKADVVIGTWFVVREGLPLR